MFNVVPVHHCRHGYAYHLRGRNMMYAVWDAHHKRFIGLREKGVWRVDSESHCQDQDARPFNSALPVAELEPCPVANLAVRRNPELWKYLIDLHGRHGIRVQ